MQLWRQKERGTEEAMKKAESVVLHAGMEGSFHSHLPKKEGEKREGGQKIFLNIP